MALDRTQRLASIGARRVWDRLQISKSFENNFVFDQRRTKTFFE
ncbi:hypothetical protein LEP1GSC036_4780 [Leptospira weilii str. 2006001853]|uniref:Uncharacterized protein n=4 Tax=Leptospira weilii TaxID=28184 RepID=A0A828Z494_9LEPT|nr:hypothetical protein LEP1GSC036_4780 [Leptospira weilii str. 2006001853]EMJ66898.1 hypothetical protein LEP1GSC051_0947 [Leptospira sp. P2653]EMM74664.1 hypothetical protein LEP1GSC038_4344 [Leptospira weilii str. 2006001855]EMN45810.1 hypothetical protein LEP1GSC086_2546 [Leptospira weilii str. LNT 1234]EMN88246.1 hypothetical protein LEP1GSC108_1480 [Leptospira weilii str. UI 13098]EMY12199.1 hypothetical protein LEP1GSC043_0970 [Leptospira weilii str. Ecochallenge]